ncbi:hypothetical protein SFRURICE_007571, partial [Spodoptera frugiperda]
LTYLFFVTDSNDGDAGVRCYCNTAQCVGTGYMCRSARSGGCYSELPRRTHHARHGCLHHLADTDSSDDIDGTRCEDDKKAKGAFQQHS